jgi:hypothetical protein
LEAKRTPPLETLSQDIECLDTEFVAAECLPSSKVPRLNGPDKDAISTARGRDDCGKPLSQHLSFGATIRTFSTNEHRFRTAVRAELEQREQPPDEAFITAKAAEAAYFQPPIPGPDARQIALEEVKAWLAMREKWRIYREKVLIFMEDEKVTEATRQRLKFWEESLGIDPAVAGALREEAAKSAPARRTGVRKQ